MLTLRRGGCGQLVFCWNVLIWPEFLKDIDAVWAGLACEGPSLARIWLDEYTALVQSCYGELTRTVIANDNTATLFDITMLKMAWLHTVIPWATRLTI